jgi:hypothetical protein
MATNREGRTAVEMYTASELHRFLVADAVKGHATTLSWAVAAYTRIATKTGKSAEDAFAAVVAEVEGFGCRMPIADPIAKAEMTAMLKPVPKR